MTPGLEGELRVEPGRRRPLGPMEQLRLAMQRLDDAHDQVLEATAARERRVREAVAAGESISDVADAVRMSDAELIEVLGR